LRASRGTTGSLALTNKLMIVGDGCGRNCRFILSYTGGERPGQLTLVRLALDGGENLVDTAPVNYGEWLNVQIELDSSSTTSSGDGLYKIWINNNDYSRPTAQRVGFQLNPVGWRNVKFGAFNNDGLTAGGIHIWRHTDFQVATSFDANWNTGSSSGGSNQSGPTTPNNLRLIGSE
jgi:hypothetical protein